jgi:hypothetical protein
MRPSAFSLGISNIPSSAAIAGIVVAIATACVPYAVLTHVFRSGSPADGDPEHNRWIMSKIGGENFLNSLYSFGYWKASWRRFVGDYKLILFPQPQAVLGSQAVDCQLVDLEGKEHSLLQDFINNSPPDVPVILNFGSYSKLISADN